MSGFYDISRYHQGEWNDYCYFHNPVLYLARYMHRNNPNYLNPPPAEGKIETKSA